MRIKDLRIINRKWNLYHCIFSTVVLLLFIYFSIIDIGIRSGNRNVQPIWPISYYDGIVYALTFLLLITFFKIGVKEDKRNYFDFENFIKNETEPWQDYHN